jgi:aminoglycoside phosphotransferase (APT) family kinase protein
LRSGPAEPSPTPGTPAAEVEIDEALLRGLLSDQMPEFADQPISILDKGWDNVSLRVGADWIARMPRRARAVPLIENEQRWLPILAPSLPLPVPTPVGIGRPGRGYPWPFSLVPFLPGRSADLDAPAADQAERFAGFLRALHRPAPSDAPHNIYRGVPIADRASSVEERLERLRRSTDRITPRIEAAWSAALEVEPATASTWLHGDLHARNVLVEEGSFTGIIDWGDMTSGDPATDLAAVWMLFENARGRRRVLDAYQASAALIARSKGWAVFFGVVLLDSGLVDDPQHAAMGKATLRHVSEDG